MGDVDWAGGAEVIVLRVDMGLIVNCMVLCFTLSLMYCYDT